MRNRCGDVLYDTWSGNKGSGSKTIYLNTFMIDAWIEIARFFLNMSSSCSTRSKSPENHDVVRKISQKFRFYLSKMLQVEIRKLRGMILRTICMSMHEYMIVSLSVCL